MQILIVKYLPSGSDSSTLKLLNYFKQKVNSNHSISELDLLKTPPKFFDELTLSAYKKRNFGGMELTAEELQAIQPLDALNEQFMNADMIVLALPMHNFSLPGIVKIYFDAVMQSGKVFKYENGAPVGLMDKLKFITLYTSGGKYNGDYEFLDQVKNLLKIELDFMGVKQYDFVNASTANPDKINIELEEANFKIDQLIENWKI